MPEGVQWGPCRVAWERAQEHPPFRGQAESEEPVVETEKEQPGLLEKSQDPGP